MALDGTYTGLKASIAEWLMRDDLTAAIPDFIAMAGNRAARKLRVADMETTATGVLTDGAAALPDDFLELRRVVSAGSTNSILEFTTPGSAGYEYQFEGAGVPLNYTITGTTITPYPTAGSGTLVIDYYAKPPVLSDAVPTNWLLSNAPEVYLYGSLIESAPFLADDNRVGVWGTLFNQACDEMQKLDERMRYGHSVSRLNSRYLP
jgi:hypothetical protein